VHCLLAAACLTARRREIPVFEGQRR
jgi:hypothetical protein